MQRVAFTVEEAAEAIGVGRSHIYVLIRRGLLVPSKLGRRTLISRSELEDALQRLRVKRDPADAA